MLIDWFTVAAQVVNFLLLVWLLKRFLYRPILDAIDARERRVAETLAEADARSAEAERERAEYRAKNEAFEQRRATLMNEATEAAHAERRRLLEEARQAADELAARRMQGLLNDSRSLDQALRHRAQQEVFAIARKTLADLADTGLEARMGELLVRRLRALDEEARGAFAAALTAAGGELRVRSAFELGEEPRRALGEALDAGFGPGLRVSFESAPELIGGIELVTQGQKMAWSIADYLTALERGVEELVKAQAQSQPQPQPQTATGSEGGDAANGT